MTVRKSLAEAAAEVLNATRTGGMPMPKLADTGSHLDTVQDIGGSTFEDPQGKGVGAKAASGVPSATAPGKTAPVGQQPADTLDGGVKAAADKGPIDVDLEGSLNKTVKPKMQPVGEEVETEEIQDEEIEELTEEEIEAARQERWEEMKEYMKSMPVKEDVDALFSGENLSEEFKTKASTIFEAAVLSRAIAVAGKLENEVIAAAEEAIEETRSELEEQINSYLDFVVENWVKENEVAIESGLRSEIAESLITGLRNVLVDHWIDIPEDKVDVLEAQAKKIEELEEQVNEALNANIEMKKAISESQKKDVLSSVCEGLTATQSEKVKTLAEGVEFTTVGDYSKKVGIIRESYISSSKVKDGQRGNVVALTESEGPAQTTEEVTGMMGRYVQAISRTQK